MGIPGITDVYSFVDWLKERNYRVGESVRITLDGKPGGLVDVQLYTEFPGKVVAGPIKQD